MSQHYARTRSLYTRATTRRYLLCPVAVVAVLIVGGIGGAIGMACVGGRSTPAAASPADAQRAASDVTMIKCALDPDTGWPKASLLVTNHSADRASYLVTVAFQSEDGATQYSTAPTSVQALASGQNAPAVAEGLSPVPRAFACAVARVDRE